MSKAPIGSVRSGPSHHYQKRLALFVIGNRWHAFEAAGLVLELDGHRSQRLGMLARVVCAKQQGAPGRQYRAQVCASTAPVATISGRQGRRSQHRSHIHVLLIGK